MRQGIKITVLLLIACILTGCGSMWHEPTEELPVEDMESWSEEVHANDVIENVDEALKSANEAIEGVKNSLTESEVMITEEGTPSVLTPIITPVPTVVPEPETYEFMQSDTEYFSDALFIGDSRTVGIQLYGSLDNADYFATPGLSLYSLPQTKVTIGEYVDITLEELLDKKDYKKVYLMLGINELGYNYEKTVEKYRELVTELRSKEPEAILYVCANLHVTKTRDENDEIHNNHNINRINAEIATLEDEKDIFYLDVNVIFDDEEGNLDENHASDDSHVVRAAYSLWCEWLGQNTIVK